MSQSVKNGKNKTHLIGYRVDEDVFNEIESRAILAGKSPNDWCRDELLARLGDGTTLTANEEIIHSEIVRFGRLTMSAFSLVAEDKFTKENWEKLIATIKDDRAEMGRKYFATITAAISKRRE
jgi:hypothetical protein